MPIHYNSLVVIFIAHNSTLYERTKHIKINIHYIWDKVTSGVISTAHVTSSHQLVNVFTMSLAKISYDLAHTKLDIFYLYATT